MSYSSFQQKYEHVGPKVTRSQDSKRSQVDDKRLCLVDDLKKLEITYKSNLKEQAQPKSQRSLHYVHKMKSKKLSLIRRRCCSIIPAKSDS
ncbi:hypothetical protein Tco_0735496 [Tanacetum coccineum]